jgi:acyl carrier protein
VDEISAKVRSILAVELQVDQSRIIPAASLREDLGMDSIAALNILFAAQEEFGIDQIDETDIPLLKTVADAERVIRRYVDAA